MGDLQNHSHPNLHLTGRGSEEQRGNLSCQESQSKLVAIAGAGSNSS